MNILMIGKSSGLCKIIYKINPEAKVYIIEESDILKKLKQFDYPNIKGVYEAKYHQSNEYMNIVEDISKTIKFDAVIPAFEYSVKPANKAAHFLNAPKLGDIGAEIFTDKIEFRKFCKEIGIPHPNFSEIKSLQELKDFFKGNPIIFKPANRHASLGVVKINSLEEIDDMYTYTKNADENVYVPNRNLMWKYLAEDYVEGQEYSVEILVQSNQIKFFNITQKQKFKNGYFVEAGHIVPADIESINQQQLMHYMELLIKKAKVEDAVLHAEWIINKNRMWIIECAARRPGDNIPELITLAYEFPFYETYIRLLSGETISSPNKNNKICAIKYFNSTTGVLKSITGTEILGDYTLNVESWDISKNPGDIISNISSSWDRIGYYIIKAESYSELADRMKIIDNKVAFNVE